MEISLIIDIKVRFKVFSEPLAWCHISTATFPSSARVWAMYLPFCDGTVYHVRRTRGSLGRKQSSLFKITGKENNNAFMTKDEKLSEVFVNASKVTASGFEFPERERKSYENPASPMASRLKEIFNVDYELLKYTNLRRFVHHCKSSSMTLDLESLDLAMSVSII